MHVRMELCDFAQVNNNKLTMVGAGWDVRPEGPAMMGLGLIVEVGWGETNREHVLVAELLDADGRPVTDPTGGRPVKVEGNFTVGRPPHHPVGSPLSIAQAFMFTLPLGAGQYVWKVSVDGKSSAQWDRPFICVKASSHPSAA